MKLYLDNEYIFETSESYDDNFTTRFNDANYDAIEVYGTLFLYGVSVAPTGTFVINKMAINIIQQ